MHIVAVIENLSEKRVQLENAKLPSTIAHLKRPGLKTISNYIRLLAEIAHKQWLKNVDLPETTTDPVAWHNVEMAAKTNGASDYEAACLSQIKAAMYWVTKNNAEL